MKSYFSIALISLLGLAGCQPSADQESKQTPAEAVTEEEVKESVERTYETIRQYTFAQKADLETWGREQLQELNRRMEELEREMDEASDEAKEEYRRTLSELQQRREVLKERLGAVQRASADAWSDAKAGFLDALKELEKGLDEAMNEFQAAGTRRSS